MALLARLVQVGINVFVEEVILDVVVLVVVGHEVLFKTAERALELVPVLIGVGAGEVVRVELEPVRVVLRVVSPVKMEDYSSVRQVTRENRRKDLECAGGERTDDARWESRARSRRPPLPSVSC